MKPLPLVLSFLFFSSLKVQGQDVTIGTISVLGIASTEIMPDEIYYKIEIQDIKDGKNPMLLDEIEQHFLAISKQLQIASNYYLYNYYADALNSGHLSGEEAIAKLDYTLRPIKLVSTVQVKFELQ